jgi:DNA polymerase III gamma/tau subunit
MKFKIQLKTLARFRFKGNFVAIKSAEKELERLKHFIQYQNKNRPLEAFFIFDDEAGNQLKSDWMRVDDSFDTQIIRLLWTIFESPRYKERIPLASQQEIVENVSQTLYDGQPKLTSEPQEEKSSWQSPQAQATQTSDWQPQQVQANLWGLALENDDELDLKEAQEEAENLKSEAQQTAKATLEKAQEEAQRLLDEAKRQAQTITEEAKDQLNQIETQVDKTKSIGAEVVPFSDTSEEAHSKASEAQPYDLPAMTENFLAKLVEKRDFYGQKYYEVEDLIQKIQGLSLELHDE